MMTDIIDDDDEVLEYDDLGDLSDLDDDMIKRFDNDSDADLDMDLSDKRKLFRRTQQHELQSL